MTPTLHTADTADATLTTAEVKQMLRDLGYALKRSRQLSAEIRAEREAKRAACVRASEGVGGLTPPEAMPAGIYRLDS